MKRGPWFTVAVLTAANIFAFVDRQVLGLLIVPVKEDLGVSDTEIGLLVGFAFALFYTVFGLPIGRLVDVGSRRMVVAVGVAVWSLCTAACGLARSFFGLFAARVGVGIGEAALGPAAYSMIGDLFPAHRRGTAIAVFTTGAALGSGIAVIMAAIIFDFLEQFESISLPLVGQVAPWQAVFFAVGLPGLLVALLALAVREPARQAASGSGVDPGAVPLPEVWRHVRSQAVLLSFVIFGFSLLAVKAYGISTWIPTFLIRTHGWSVGEAGIYYGLTLAIAATVGVLVGGRLSDWLAVRGIPDAKLRIALAGNLLTLGPIVAYPLVGDAVTALVLIAAYYVFAALTTPMGVAVLQEITPPRLRGQVSALFLFMVTLIGMGFGPLSVGLITDFVFDDPADLRYSLAIVPVVTISVALILLLKARTLFLQLPERL
jgi:MFS family permease